MASSSSCDYSLFALDRAIDALYSDLPWPKEFTRVGFNTRAMLGYGDLSAAAKAIKVMRRLAPGIAVTWVVRGSVAVESDLTLPLRARRFFSEEDPIEIVKYDCATPNREVDFAVLGPGKEERMMTQAGLSVPKERCCGFVEIGFRTRPQAELQTEEIDPDAIYPKFFDRYFHLQGYSPCADYKDPYYFAMGLQEGSGIFLEQELCKAPLPLGGYADPGQLLQIEDAALKQSILTALEGDLEYRTHSFNSGYAWQINPKIYFTEIVARQLALHEPDKNVVFLFNQTDYGKVHSVESFVYSLQYKERFEYFRSQGFGTIEVVGEKEKIVVVESPGRRLTIILSPFLQPSDMRRVQLASERLLTTGDNSAAEGLAARCKLFLYEMLDHKTVFLEQQCSVAQSISPDLALLIRTFGRSANSMFGMKPPPPGGMIGENAEQANVRVVIDALLKSPTLGQETLAFCNRVIEKRSFEPVLRNAFLRTAYRSLYPELAAVERDCLDEDVKKRLHLATRFEVRNLPLMKERILSVIRGSHGQ